MDTRVSLKQALKSLGFQGGNKHDTELNQWMNHEKKCWQRLQSSMGLNGNRKVLMRNIWMFITSRKKNEKGSTGSGAGKEYLTAENEGLTAQIAESEQIFRF